ncbi:hypothetical protein M3Y94_00141700 [Aphelenchoides besseyi]|nr:hypothetical protein M3Y94_00141700 [Aphelenchoides besseyi]KAI6237235.1 CBR-SMK-1 protein [Aphelenchoides besseyi]
MSLTERSEIQITQMAVRDVQTNDGKQTQRTTKVLVESVSISVDDPSNSSSRQLNGQHASDAPKLTNDSSEELIENLGASTEKSDVPDDPGVQRPTNVSEERLNQIPILRSSANRVKLYILCDQRTWDDRGTGHVVCVQVPENTPNWCLIVRLESNEANVLESPVLRDTVYQRQQGTLIVWSESETCDLALSFQEKSGCAAIWDKICQIQGRDPDIIDDEADVDDQQSDSSNSNGSTGLGPSVSLPPCNVNNINDIEQIISNNMGNPSSREKMANALQQQNYLARLTEVFRQCEDVEHTNLPLFYSIAKNMFLLNTNVMLNELLNEKYFRDVVGMLEYDPASAEPKRHREFLFEKSRFKEVLPIKSDELKSKIQLTYRVQYVQDVCLPAPSLFEENLLTCLSSHLFFSRAEIVNQLISDKELMKRLFDELKTPDLDMRRRRDLTQFLREFCSFVHSLQSSAASGREQFFKTILTNDMLSAIDLCISSGSPSTRNSAIEIVAMIIDYNSLFMRDFLLRQARSVPEDRPDDVLFNKIVKLIMLDKDPELSMANNISMLIKNLLDSDNVSTMTSLGRPSPRSLLEKTGGTKAEKLDFFSMFYNRIIDTLVKPLFDNVKNGNLVRDDYFKANQMALIMELTSFCVENHVQSMRNVVIQKNLLAVLGVHLKSRHHFMALSALRVFRRIIQQKDEQYNRYIVENRSLDPVIECFVANSDRYNLMNSAILELFDFMSHFNIVSLIVHVVRTYYNTALKDVMYTKLFTQMKARVDAMENCKSDTSDLSSSSTSDDPKRLMFGTQWRKEKDYDNEELFFNEDEEDDELEPGEAENVPERKLPQRKMAVEPMYPSVAKRKLNTEDDGVGSIFGGNLSPSISGSNPLRKIVIKMSDRPESASTPPPQQSDDDSSEITIPAMQFGTAQNSPSTSISPLATSSFTSTTLTTITEDDHEPEFKRSRLSSLSPNAAFMKRALFNQSRSVSTTNGPSSIVESTPSTELEFEKPILLKGYNSLVDYPLDDEEDEDSTTSNGSKS